MSSPEEQRLSPERRVRLYTRLAQVFREAGETSLADTALDEATQAIRESPEMQRELRELLTRIEEMER